MPVSKREWPFENFEFRNSKAVRLVIEAQSLEANGTANGGNYVGIIDCPEEWPFNWHFRRIPQWKSRSKFLLDVASMHRTASLASLLCTIRIQERVRRWPVRTEIGFFGFLTNETKSLNSIRLTKREPLPMDHVRFLNVQFWKALNKIQVQNNMVQGERHRWAQELSFFSKITFFPFVRSPNLVTLSKISLFMLFNVLL